MIQALKRSQNQKKNPSTAEAVLLRGWKNDPVFAAAAGQDQDHSLPEDEEQDDNSCCSQEEEAATTTRASTNNSITTSSTSFCCNGTVSTAGSTEAATLSSHHTRNSSEGMEMKHMVTTALNLLNGSTNSTTKPQHSKNTGLHLLPNTSATMASSSKQQQQSLVINEKATRARGLLSIMQDCSIDIDEDEDIDSDLDGDHDDIPTNRTVQSQRSARRMEHDGPTGSRRRSIGPCQSLKLASSNTNIPRTATARPKSVRGARIMVEEPTTNNTNTRRHSHRKGTRMVPMMMDHGRSPNHHDNHSKRTTKSQRTTRRISHSTTEPRPRHCKSQRAQRAVPLLLMDEDADTNQVQDAPSSSTPTTRRRQPPPRSHSIDHYRPATRTTSQAPNVHVVLGTSRFPPKGQPQQRRPSSHGRRASIQGGGSRGSRRSSVDHNNNDSTSRHGSRRASLNNNKNASSRRSSLQPKHGGGSQRSLLDSSIVDKSSLHSNHGHSNHGPSLDGVSRIQQLGSAFQTLHQQLEELDPPQAAAQDRMRGSDLLSLADDDSAVLAAAVKHRQERGGVTTGSSKKPTTPPPPPPNQDKPAAGDMERALAHLCPSAAVLLRLEHEQDDDLDEEEQADDMDDSEMEPDIEDDGDTAGPNQQNHQKLQQRPRRVNTWDPQNQPSNTSHDGDPQSATTKRFPPRPTSLQAKLAAAVETKLAAPRLPRRVNSNDSFDRVCAQATAKPVRCSKSHHQRRSLLLTTSSASSSQDTSPVVAQRLLRPRRASTVGL